MYILVGNLELLNQEETQFAENQLSHVDFLLYNSLSKRPIGAIEVDGWYFHNSDVQIHRDNIKNEIFKKIGLPLIRISTNETLTENKMTDYISKIIK